MPATLLLASVNSVNLTTHVATWVSYMLAMTRSNMLNIAVNHKLIILGAMFFLSMPVMLARTTQMPNKAQLGP